MTVLREVTLVVAKMMLGGLPGPVGHAGLVFLCDYGDATTHDAAAPMRVVVVVVVMEVTDQRLAGVCSIPSLSNLYGHTTCTKCVQYVSRCVCVPRARRRIRRGGVAS